MPFLKRKKEASLERPGLNMTPMIDVVFNLMIFFIMTFKIVAPEGDFNVRMPKTAPGTTPSIDQAVPIIVKLEADSEGNLNGIRMDSRSLGTRMYMLREEVRKLTGGDPATAENMELELDCDPQLRYEYTMEAITQVSGYFNEQGEQVPMITKIKFARRP